LRRVKSLLALVLPVLPNVADPIRLPLQVVFAATLAEAALDLAVQHGSTAYDSAYIVLVQKRSLPLVAADEALSVFCHGLAMT
jgi:hypothetical protein